MMSEMLEESFKKLEDVSFELQRHIKADKVSYEQNAAIVEKNKKVFEEIRDNEQNHTVLRLFASYIITNEYHVTAEVARNNVYNNLMSQFIIATELAVISIYQELAKLQKPSTEISEDSERLNILEEKSAKLKKEIKNMKPFIVNLKKDYALRKRWIKENR